MFDGSSTRRATTRAPTAGAPLRSSTRPQTAAPRDKRMSSSRAGARRSGMTTMEAYPALVTISCEDGSGSSISKRPSSSVRTARTSRSGRSPRATREDRAHFAVGLIAACNPDGRAAERPVVGVGDDAAANHDRRWLSARGGCRENQCEKKTSPSQSLSAHAVSVRGPGWTGQRISSVERHARGAHRTLRGLPHLAGKRRQRLQGETVLPRQHHRR